MSKLNAGNIYLNAIKSIVDTPTTSNEKPSKFSGGGLMGNGSGEDTKEQPYYEPHLQAFLRAAQMRKEVNDG